MRLPRAVAEWRGGHMDTVLHQAGNDALAPIGSLSKDTERLLQTSHDRTGSPAASHGQDYLMIRRSPDAT
jgi:hypothetical protein